jgi:hypothetical protein
VKKKFKKNERGALFSSFFFSSARGRSYVTRI